MREVRDGSATPPSPVTGLLSQGRRRRPTPAGMRCVIGTSDVATPTRAKAPVVLLLLVLLVEVDEGVGLELGKFNDSLIMKFIFCNYRVYAEVKITMDLS